MELKKVCYKCNSELLIAFKFCPYCGASQSNIECRECGYNNEPNSKFCQECGTPISSRAKKKETSKSVVIDKPIPEYGITVEFNYSTSQTFDFALEEAKKFNTFQQIGEEKKAIYRVNVSDDQIESLEPLIENLKGWRNRRVYYNGEKVQWDTIFQYHWCYSSKKSCYKPELYCFGYENDYQFNLWGCIQAGLNFRENSELFTYGKWLNSKGDWEFDKNRIKHELERSIYPYRFCPAMNLELIQDVLTAFPDRVNPAKDKDWKFVRNYNSEDGLRIVENRYGYNEEYFMNGAEPASMKKFLTQITNRMTKKLPSGI